LHLNIKKSNNKRIKYLKYILNFIIKIFLFSKDINIFKENINSKYNNIYIKKL